MTFLLDINVLIALIDPAHISHDAAHRWFETVGRESWATCPITENGVIRIVGHPRYPNRSGSTADVAVILRTMRALSGHAFWPDSLSLIAAAHVDIWRFCPPADTYRHLRRGACSDNKGNQMTFG